LKLPLHAPTLAIVAEARVHAIHVALFELYGRVDYQFGPKGHQMRRSRCTTLTCAVLLAVQANADAAQNVPGSAGISPAHVALRFDPIRHCPDLRIAEDGAAVVVFLVGVSGVPSRAFIKSSSGSEALDTAAMNCVLKLRFQPVTRAGDGVAVDSWQEIAWRWATQREQRRDPQGTANRASLQDDQKSIGLVAAKENDAGIRPESAPPKEAKVELHVCSDVAGKLAQDPTVIRSSGDPGLDEAAVAIAKSGSGYYRPATTLGGKPVSGCAQLAIKFEIK
jgi:TonB family protein